MFLDKRLYYYFRVDSLKSILTSIEELFIFNPVNDLRVHQVITYNAPLVFLIPQA